MRILDLGCGPGCDLVSWGVQPSDEVVGVDINESHLQEARKRFPQRTYLHGAGESLPCESESFDRVISAVALPYMDIPKALAEAHRVLIPDGKLAVSLHSPGFTMHELLHHAIPKPKATMFRLYVMANGLWFHASGRTLRMFGKSESFQTERGMMLALTHAGFRDAHFSSVQGPGGREFRVEARKNRER